MGHKSKAFTLLELLVVILIISILIAILIPVLSSAREQGRNVSCLSNQHQFSVAIIAFSNDHKDHLPAVYTWNLPDLEPWQRDWLSGAYGPGNTTNPHNYYNHAPEEGTLFEYMGSSIKSYRCPSLSIGTLGSGIGSNGKYDYTLISGFGGAKVWELPDRIYRRPIDALGFQFPYTITLPFFVEESPKYHLNSTAIRGAFALDDRINVQHSGNSNYSSPDGSASRFSNEFKELSGNEMVAIGKGRYQQDGVIVGVSPQDFDMWNWINSH